MSIERKIMTDEQGNRYVVEIEETRANNGDGYMHITSTPDGPVFTYYKQARVFKVGGRIDKL